MVIHHNTKIHSNCPINHWDRGQKMTLKAFMWPLTCDLDLLGKHFMNKKLSTYNYTSPFQTSFQLLHLTLRYGPKHGFQDFNDLWPVTLILYMNTLSTEIFHSWLYITIPKIIQIGWAISEISSGQPFCISQWLKTGTAESYTFKR